MTITTNIIKKGYVSLVEQACAGVAGFRDSYQQFHQKAVIEQSSSYFVENYGRVVTISILSKSILSRTST